MFPPAPLSLSLSLSPSLALSLSPSPPTSPNLEHLNAEIELKLSHEILKVLCTPGCFHIGIGDVDLGGFGY